MPKKVLPPKLRPPVDPLGADLSLMPDGHGEIVFEPSTGTAIPTYLDRVRRDPHKWAIVRKIQQQVDALAYGREQLDHSVAAARAAGVSWNVIGYSTGMTGQSARERWGD